MNKILLITNIYPTNDPSYGGTSVCHYFTKEWIKMGYNVKVIHFESLFPKIYYWIGLKFKSFLQAKTGCVVYTNTPKSHKEYHVDGVSVLFVPIRKTIPHKHFSSVNMQKAFNVVVQYLEYQKFVPNAIVGHFILPQLHFLYMFKNKYPKAKTAMILHSSGERIKSVYGHNFSKYMKAVDSWGFRSVAFQNKFEDLYGKQKNEFLCYSGIPERYMEQITKYFDDGVTKFVFLGSLYKLKRVDSTLMALNKAFGRDSYKFDIVGSGAEEISLKSLTRKLQIEDKVIFHGRQPRDIAQKIMSEADCFIMVSEHEAFGLVYIEAMAKGCITIATRGQGIDGVIVDGKNGFLCEAGNIDELAEIIIRLRFMSKNELNQISINAQNTVSELTNKKVAESYINAVLNK